MTPEGLVELPIELHSLPGKWRMAPGVDCWDWAWGLCSHNAQAAHSTAIHLVVSCCDSSPPRAEARWAAKGAGAGVLDERESLWLTSHGGLKVQGLHLSVR